MARFIRKWDELADALKAPHLGALQQWQKGTDQAEQIKRGQHVTPNREHLTTPLCRGRPRRTP
jgi:hypothetical protein